MTTRTYWISLGFISETQRSAMGASYCEGYSQDSSRCEIRTIGGIPSTIDWKLPVEYNTYSYGSDEPKKGVQIKAYVGIPHPSGGMVTFELQPVAPESKETFDQILSSFKFIE